MTFYGWYMNDDTIFLAMEYCPLGDLSRYVYDIHGEEAVRSIAAQLITALCEMHRNQMVHRDLNPRVSILSARVGNYLSAFLRISSLSQLSQTGASNSLTSERQRKCMTQLNLAQSQVRRDMQHQSTPTL